MIRIILPLAILAIASSLSFGQTNKVAERTEKDEALIKSAIAFLRETSVDVDRMRSAENRLSFSAELASLMWLHDEKSARGMYAAAINDFKMLISSLDAQMNMAPVNSDDEVPGFSLFGPGRSAAERKFSIAMLVRQQIAMGLAEHDPDMSLAFFYETAAMFTNPRSRDLNSQSDRMFEAQLIKQIAEKDAAKALKYGNASLKDGIDGNEVELLKKIYAKDHEKGIEFGEAILSSIRSDRSSVKGLWVYSSLLSYGAEILSASKKPDAKKPVFSEGDLRTIADVFAQVLLAQDSEEELYSIHEFVNQIDRFSPGRAAQIRSKYKIENTKVIHTTNSLANVSVASNTAKAMSNTNSAVAQYEALQRQNAEREKEFADGIRTLEKPLPKDERDKVIARARALISQTKSTEAKITGLSLLAAQVAKAGDAELAEELMLDADRLVNPYPKNYRDYLLSWLLASGYAESNPKKAFPLLESTIMRANDTIAAFAKVAEFIDVNEEMISDGEVQVGAFGGTVLRGMTRDLGIANTTLISLAKADFEKTRAITEKFDRPEVRVLAKMLVLRAVLDEKKPVAGPPLSPDEEPSARLAP